MAVIELKNVSKIYHMEKVKVKAGVIGKLMDSIIKIIEKKVIYW